MPRYSLNLIMARRSYCISEIATLLGVNRRTCGRWVKREGLKAIKENANPLLIMGRDLIDFIKTKRNERKMPLKVNEYFCFKCRKAVRAKIGSEQIIETGKRMGKDNREQLKKTGVCEYCQTEVNKFLRVCQRD